MLSTTPALWNRKALVLTSDEILAQILDRGTLEDHRELYRLAKEDCVLRRRIANLVARVPLPTPHFWLAALASLGESVDHDRKLPAYDELTL